MQESKAPINCGDGLGATTQLDGVRTPKAAALGCASGISSVSQHQHVYNVLKGVIICQAKAPVVLKRLVKSAKTKPLGAKTAVVVFFIAMRALFFIWPRRKAGNVELIEALWCFKSSGGVAENKGYQSAVTPLYNRQEGRLRECRCLVAAVRVSQRLDGSK